MSTPMRKPPSGAVLDRTCEAQNRRGCSLPAGAVVTVGCVNEHVRTVPACTEHRELLALDVLWCGPCWHATGHWFRLYLLTTDEETTRG